MIMKSKEPSEAGQKSGKAFPEYSSTGGAGNSTCDERADKPGLRGTGAARTPPMKYRDE
jgi:hypothetical protein